jgi:hypothetical protein
MFADDTSLLVHDKYSSNLQHKVNEDLNCVTAWLTANKLALNLSKSHFMLFSKQSSSCVNVNLKINDVALCKVKSVKFLGIIMDDGLSWREHISHISKKISKCIGIMYKIRRLIDMNTCKSLYYTLAYPYFTYCNIVWGSTYKTYMLPLVILQKRIIRVINGNFGSLEHTEPLFLKTKIIKFNHLHKYLMAQFMFNFHHGCTPDLFNNFFTYNRAVHNYNTRQRHCFHIPKVKTNLGKRCLRYEGPVVWNDVMKEIDVNCTLNTFKVKLKCFFFEQFL